MATLHAVPLSRFPADWETETYSDTTFLAAIAPFSRNTPLTDDAVTAMESVTDYLDGDYPDSIRAEHASDVEQCIFLVTDSSEFPKSASEIRSNLSFPHLDNFCYDTDLLRAQAIAGGRMMDRAVEMLANLR